MFSAQVSVRVIGFKQGHGLGAVARLYSPGFAEMQKLIKRDSIVSRFIRRGGFKSELLGGERFFHRAKKRFQT